MEGRWEGMLGVQRDMQGDGRTRGMGNHSYEDSMNQEDV